MNIKLIHTTLLLALCAALASCSADDAWNTITPNGKTPIELSVGGVDAPALPGTRAVITSDQGKTMKAFPKGSSIYMLMMANEVGGTGVKTTRTIGFAQDKNPYTNISDVSFTASNEGNVFVRYWEDAYARNTALSIAAVSTPGYGPSAAGAATIDNKTWSIGGIAGFQNISWTTPGSGDIATSTYVDWPVGTHSNKDDQSVANFVSFQDLCFSNNIGDNTKYSLSDTRIKFDSETKTFGNGHLIFNHALTKLTFRIKMGEGFTDAQFTFDAGTNIKLSNFYKSGRFIIGTGEFSTTSPNAPVKADIEKINQRTTPESGDKFTLDALVVPGTDMTSSDDAVTFYINHNEYKLTMAQLYNAILNGTTNAAYLSEHTGKVDPNILAEETTNGGGKFLKAGVHYVFTFTVGKTTINSITAQVADWEEVTADNINPTTTTVSVTTATIGDHKTDATDFDLYRLPYISNAESIDLGIKNYDWTGRYTDKATLSGPTNNIWSTNWYWESNKHFYHFRAVSPKNTTVNNGSSADDFLTLNTAAVTTSPASLYTDVLWGAPFIAPTGTGSKYGYDPVTHGFDGTAAPSTHQIHHGIVTTSSTINLLLFHMMSDVTFNITTTTGADKVLLQENSKDTKVELIEYYPNGKVLMGNGLVQTTEDKSTTAAGYNLTLDRYTAESSPNPAKSVFHYGVVPQSLENVVLRITTPDNNQYIVDLKDVKSASIVTNNLANPYLQDDGKYVINRWYPGFRYTYNLTLKKSGITNLTATIVQWEEITADNDNVTIK